MTDKQCEVLFASIKRAVKGAIRGVLLRDRKQGGETEVWCDGVREWEGPEAVALCEYVERKACSAIGDIELPARKEGGR